MPDDRPDESKFTSAAGTRWLDAIRSPFLEAAGTGQLPAETFHRWLVQDYHFAVALTSFEAVLASRVRRPAQSAVILGLRAMDDELGWFEEQAKSRGLALDGPIHPVCRRYADFLLAAAHQEPAGALLAVLYGVEVSYWAAWSALEPAGPYGDFIGRWSSPVFRDWVGRLARLAEEHRTPESQRLFDAVLRHERDFWSMAWNG